ncbi:hypothetical protein [Tropicimonas marinistellae]|uniref:hypothetical protein n=1 Tax=Tropicimonas marinistellae TaxID=1739787 RepID=UPI0008371BA3|nr:hypothetical protein [Tropicimonas marinistellae]
MSFNDARLRVLASLAAAVCFGGSVAQAQDSNACPVDGCEVSIAAIEQADGELALVFEANFLPDMSKNHIHVWWGDLFDAEQVSNNAETVHGVTQGEWHPTDSYPDYVTTSAVSVSQRNDTETICVTAADRNHDVLDPAAVHCVSVADKL